MGNDFPTSRQGLGNVRPPGPPNPLKGGFCAAKRPSPPIRGSGGPAAQRNVSNWLSPRWKVSSGRLSKVPPGAWKRPPAWTPKPPERGLFARRSVLLPLSGGRGVLPRAWDLVHVRVDHVAPSGLESRGRSDCYNHFAPSGLAAQKPRRGGMIVAAALSRVDGSYFAGCWCVARVKSIPLVRIS